MVLTDALAIAQACNDESIGIVVVRILLVDIGDKSLNEYGSWPWTRDILGDVLLRMRDLGAKTAVFDIEYLSDSSLTVDEGINDITQSAFTNGEETIAGAISDWISCRYE